MTAPTSEPWFLDLAELDRLSDQLQREGRTTVPLVGGEPTLHPAFRQAVESILARGMTVRLFTHGQLANDLLTFLASLPVRACLSVVNASASLRRDGSLPAPIRHTLATLGPRACLGMTLTTPFPPYEPSLDLYEQLGLAPWFRLGLSQPTLDGRNGEAPDYRMPGLGDYITSLCLALTKRGGRVDYDCGFVKCTFTKHQLAELEAAGAPIRSVCGTIPDVAPGGTAWPCYPLSDAYRTTFGTDTDLQQLRSSFDRKLSGFRAIGLYDECASCEFFADRSCTGGCVARIIPQFVQLRKKQVESSL